MYADLSKPDSTDNINKNTIVAFNPKICELAELLELNLIYLNMKGSLCSNIGSLHSIRYINLSHNSLTGSLPTSLKTLNFLRDLDLQHN